MARISPCKEHHDVIVEMLENDYTMREICDRIGVARGILKYYIQTNGLTDIEIRRCGVKLEDALEPDECIMMRSFLRTLLLCADSCIDKSKLDVSWFMSEYRDQFGKKKKKRASKKK